MAQIADRRLQAVGRRQLSLLLVFVLSDDALAARRANFSSYSLRSKAAVKDLGTLCGQDSKTTTPRSPLSVLFMSQLPPSRRSTLRVA